MVMKLSCSSGKKGYRRVEECNQVTGTVDGQVSDDICSQLVISAITGDKVDLDNS